MYNKLELAPKTRLNTPQEPHELSDSKDATKSELFYYSKGNIPTGVLLFASKELEAQALSFEERLALAQELDALEDEDSCKPGYGMNPL